MDGSRPETEAPGRPRRFRWRIIPAVLLFGLGGAHVLGGLWSLAFAALSLTRPVISPEQARFLAIQGSLLFAGVIWLASGRWCMQGRWRWAIAGAAAGYAYGLAVQGVSAVLR